MTERFDAKDLARAVDAGILQPGQEQALLAFLRQQPENRGTFQLAHVAFYFGALLIMGAMGWLLTEAWMRIGDSALLAIALLYIVLLTGFAMALQRRQQPIAAGVLAAVAVSIVPLAVFAIERMLGWWPLDDTQADYHQYYTYVQGGWLLMEAATVLAGLLMLRLVPFPFIVMPIAVALWFMSMDLSEWFFGSPFSWEQRRTVSLWFGLALLLVFVVVDGRTRRDYAFWGYLAGLAAFWGGLTLMNSDSELGKALYCLVNLGLMGLAVLLRRPVFMVFGAMGVAAYLGYLSYEVFADSLLFPLVLTLIGLGVIGLGLLYQKRREQLSQSLRARLPSWLQQALPALRD
ncbi:DUF2157 domain-containing protein [Pseudomonas guariconensis]|uniref:DUF2157 domain-containing protein n=1 Tax=Pseudomonas TaxID=286 RepID=UPI002096F93E|nr:MULTISPECIES: DUF2157 domain-containing protein [Pseudomonas]MCO7638314.1 DUF2157 domain-containing protein [Pseudomonas sp. S 311-6]MCO7514109.1 DUF2157 domain-containing protein [Pseudomonas putida]MCO7564376.1 DUF2157 domain-containing protein [Pseudomonas mosselii]MCO7605162.1 DUF2157 domain-containing protein [Pseudomonas guariconensis]MCO7615684.1 DUF2157 domain-containing protein [Pseudomonas guariconensis]